jgi:hypothetical protein
VYDGIRHTALRICRRYGLTHSHPRQTRSFSPNTRRNSPLWASALATPIVIWAPNLLSALVMVSQGAQVLPQRPGVGDVGDALQAVRRVDDKFCLARPPPVDRGLARAATASMVSRS